MSEIRMAGEEDETETEAEKKLEPSQVLLQQDPEFASSNTSSLHAAALEGNLDIVKEVLRRNPQLAREVNSQNSSPLHIAAAQGSVEIASLLAAEAPDVCWWRDWQGMNPLHVAAMNGHVEILRKLLHLDPFPAREKLDRGQNVLHLCVKHRQLRALELFVRGFRDLVFSEDDDGDTVLHFATRYKQVEMVEYLVRHTKINKHARNSKGKKALQILLESRPLGGASSKIYKILGTGSSKLPRDFIQRLREIIMVVAVLIATMAFQAVVSPPGGIWQDNSSTHRAGEAIMASTRPKIYSTFVRANTVAFVSSLVIIFLVTLSVRNAYLVAAIIYTLLVTLAATAVSYGAALTVITPSTETQSLAHVINVVIAVSVTLLVGVWFVQDFSKIMKRIKRLKKKTNKKKKKTKTQEVLHEVQVV